MQVETLDEFRYRKVEELGRPKTVKLVVAGEDILPPGLVVEVPLDGFAEAALEIFLGFPAEFVFDF